MWFADLTVNSDLPGALKIPALGTPLAVQWLRLHSSTAGGTRPIPGWATKIPNAVWCGQNK